MKNIYAFSLIEVLIFITILSVFFIAALSVTTFSLRNMQVNEHKIAATHYAEELSSWIASQKENDWNLFATKISGSAYCFKTILPNSDWPSASPCGTDTNNKIDGFYKREASITGDSTQINVTVSVSWDEAGSTYSVPINTVYRIWE